MNEFEIKAFQQANPQLNIINIVSVIYDDVMMDMLTLVIFFKKDGIFQVAEIEIADDDEDMQNLPYSYKEYVIKEVIRGYLGESLSYIVKGATIEQEDIGDAAYDLMWTYQKLEEIGYCPVKCGDYKEAYDDFLDECEEFVKNQKQLGIDSATDIYDNFLKKYSIDQQSVEQYINSGQVKLKYDYKIAWINHTKEIK